MIAPPHQVMVALEIELSNTQKRSKSAPEPLLLSAGGTCAALGTALLTELACFVGVALEAARTAHQLATEVTTLLPAPELVSPLAALQVRCGSP